MMRQSLELITGWADVIFFIYGAAGNDVRTPNFHGAGIDMIRFQMLTSIILKPETPQINRSILVKQSNCEMAKNLLLQLKNS